MRAYSRQMTLASDSGRPMTAEPRSCTAHTALVYTAVVGLFSMLESASRNTQTLGMLRL